MNQEQMMLRNLRNVIGDYSALAYYGIGKRLRDFEYIFQALHPSFYIDDEAGVSEYQGLPVYGTNELEGKLDGCKIIVFQSPSMDLEDVKKRLAEIGLNWGRDYFFADELFVTLDFNWRENVRGRKIAFWGTGITTLNYFRSGLYEKSGVMPDIFINGTGNVHEGETIRGIPLRSPEQVDFREYYTIVMTQSYYYEIQDYLNRAGLTEYEDYAACDMVFDLVHGKASDMMRETYFASPLKNQPFCTKPFSFAFFNESGDITPCHCMDYIRSRYNDIGNLNIYPADEIWNSWKAKIFRLSVLNGTYSFCHLDRCEILLPYREEDDDLPMKIAPSVSDAPTNLVLNISAACNLRCLSCRKKGQYNSNERNKRAKLAMAERLKRSKWLDNADSALMAGFGEVFYSDIYRSLLYHDNEKKRKHIRITSNGNLFTEEEFQHLRACYETVRCDISVDGVTKEVYEKLRPGGNFNALMKNLRNVSEHRKNGEISCLEINFVVQRENFRQMKDIVRLAEELHADYVYFMHLRDWGIYPKEEFRKVCLYDEKGVLDPELLEILQDPVFDSPIVYMDWFRNRMNNMK